VIIKQNKHMKKSYPFLILFMAPLMYVLLTSELLSSGGSPGGKTGSPGDAGATCTQCHGGTATTQTGWITSSIPGSGYVPGQTYTITVTGNHPGVVKFGFEATAENTTGQKVGTFIITNAAQTSLINNNAAVTHTSGGTAPSAGSKSWSFDWTAPASGSGSVTFYAAFNAANGNFSTSGDVIYRSQLTVFQSTVGISEMQAAAVSVFPNPAYDHVTIAGLDDPGARAQVYTRDGRCVLDTEVSGNKVMLDGLLPGTYILRVTGNSSASAFSLVKR
jgi:hypothetical protein